MKLNFKELNRDWEENFHDGDWEPDTLEYTDIEKKIVDELKVFLPRHMDYYDWNLPYADGILMIFRRHLNPPQDAADEITDFPIPVRVETKKLKRWKPTFLICR